MAVDGQECPQRVDQSSANLGITRFNIASALHAYLSLCYESQKI